MVYDEATMSSTAQEIVLSLLSGYDLMYLALLSFLSSEAATLDQTERGPWRRAWPHFVLPYALNIVLILS